MATLTAALVNRVSNAIRLRAIGAGASTFADQTWVYDTGVLDSATDAGSGNVTVGDSTKTWTFAGGTLKRWTQATPGSNGIPAWDWGSYDLVIEAPSPDYTPDPRKVLQAAITAQPDATHVTIPLAPADRIAERRITAVADLVGRRYWILRAGGSNWTRGYFDQPNDPILTTGLVTAAQDGALQSDRPLQHVASLVGQDVLYRDAANKLQRGRVFSAGARSRVLLFSGTTARPVVGQRFFVVSAGGLWVWDAQGGTADTAYSGLRSGNNYLGHYTDDAVGSVAMPSLTYPFLYGQDAGSCPIAATDTPIFNSPDDDGRDVDLWYPQDNACGTRDTFVNPRVHKSIRAWWSDLMLICTGYIPNTADYTGAGAIPNFTIATWLYAAGVNGVSGTAGTHSGTTMPCALGVPHAPVTLWWTIKGADGSDLISGYEPAYDGANLNGAFSAAHDGKPVIASTGPTRPVPKRFALMHDGAYFLTDVSAGAAQTPPSASFPGTWTIRPRSTHYRMSDADGFVGDSALARHAIADGDYARWVGDCFHDPGFAARLPDDGAQPLAPYHNYAYVGTRAPATQAAIDASRRGTATGGSTVRLVDASKNWLAVDFYPSTNGLTQTGTFTSGSTTGGTDSTKAGAALWAASRFSGFASSLAGFTVEVLIAGSSFADPAAVVEKRLIATGNGTTGALTWSEALSASANGKSYRIREPAVLNRWRSNNVPLVAGAADRSVTVTHPNGQVATRAILGNHDDTLFVDTLPFAVVAGCTYTINVPEMSGVYHRVAGQWVTTANAGADPRYPGAVFRRKAANNQEDKFSERGLYRPNDQPFTVACFTEICNAVNALDMISVGGGWIDSSSNKREAQWHDESTYALWLDGVTNGGAGRTPPDTDTSYYPFNGPGSDTGPPFAVWDAWVTGQYLPPTPSWQVTSGFVGDVRRQFNHYQITLPDNVYAKSVAFYNFATLPATVMGTPSAHNVSTVDFDANGDLVAQDVWTQWATDSGTTGTVTSAPLGSLTIPDAATAPSIAALPPATVPDSGTSGHTLGYKVTAALATISYGFPALTL